MVDGKRPPIVVWLVPIMIGIVGFTAECEYMHSAIFLLNWSPSQPCQQ
jgi:hypothetical protein